MSERNRSGRIATLVFVVSLIAICFCAWVSNQPIGDRLLEPPQNWNAYNSEAKAPEYQPTDINPSQGTSGLIIWQDGIAQWIMMGFTALATVISGFGIWLLLDNLRLTRKAVESANDAVEVTREIGQAQTRAWVSYENIAIHIDTNDDKISTSIKFVWINAGNSPATNTAIKFSKFVTPMDFTFKDFPMDQIPVTAYDEATPIGPGRTINSGAMPLTEEDIGLIVNRHRRVFYAAKITYNTIFPFIDGPRESAACFELEIIGISPGQAYTAEKLKSAFNCRVIGPFNFVT